MGDADRTERLARALRENLRRRKGRARELPPPDNPDEAGPDAANKP